MDPAVVYEKMREMHRKMDRIDKKLDDLSRQVVETNRQVNTIAIVQRTEDETLRKSANSINVIVRIVSGIIGMSSTDLAALLVESKALRATVQPKPNWNFEQIPLTGYPPMHELKLILTQLIQIIDNHRLNIIEDDSDIVPITTISSSLPTVSCTITSTATSSQNESSAVSSSSTQGTSVVSTASPQKENSAALPVLTQETGMGSSHTNIRPLKNNVPNLKTKEDEIGALRRKYKNKYRYLNFDKKQCATPVEIKNNVSNIHIPEPYRDPIFHNVKEIEIINCMTKKSVIKPLSFFHPHIVIKPSDIANCAAVAPRIKNVNENHLQKKNPSNNSDNSDISNCKTINERRHLRRHCKITKKKNIKSNDEDLTAIRKRLRSKTGNFKCDLHYDMFFKKPLDKK